MEITAKSPDPDTKLSQPAAGQYSYKWYLLSLLGIVLALYIAPYCFIRTPQFERWFGSRYGPDLDYGFKASGVNADIVIFGDSSALYGVDLRLLGLGLNARAINLPNTRTSLAVLGDAALHHYLNNNVKPKLIIFYLTPWDLDFSNEVNKDYIVEGEEMLYRHGTPTQIWHFVKANPSGPLVFPFEFYEAAWIPSIRALLKHENREASIAATMGHMDFPVHKLSVGGHRELASSCDFPDKITRASGLLSTRELISKYANTGMSTLLFLAPIPNCRNVDAVLQHSYQGLPVAPPKVMEPGSFIGDDSFTHLDPKAETQATEALLDAVRSSREDLTLPVR